MQEELPLLGKRPDVKKKTSLRPEPTTGTQYSLSSGESPASVSDTTPADTAQPQAYTITQLTLGIKNLLEKRVGTVWVRGEISNYRPAASGHLYFSLKDEGAMLSCAMFKSGGSRSRATPLKDGMEVMARGRISVYAPRGSYQLLIDSIEPLGAGALTVAFEQLKQKLQAEGLFDPARKKPIPTHPTRVVLITSPTGAALQDMLNVLGRRNAGINLMIMPCLVQGDEAPPQVVAALETANRHGLGDVIIVARGGGSIEDLWCFNNEAVVRAVAASRIPVISAVGHEIDFTLCDFAADLRAPTPSAAAELVSKSRLELCDALSHFERRLRTAAAHRVTSEKGQLLALEARLVSPAERVARSAQRLEELELRLTHGLANLFPPLRQRLDEAENRMTRAVVRVAAERHSQTAALAAGLEALSPLKVLGRGYTLVEDSKNSALLKSAQDARAGSQVSLIFHDGKVPAQIL